jgi:hypothetical protein
MVNIENTTDYDHFLDESYFNGICTGHEVLDDIKMKWI